MSKKSKHSSRTQTTRKPVEPFNSEVLRKARKKAGEYHIVIERNERLGFIGSSVELPNVYAEGKTADECYRAAQEALTIAVATMVEAGRQPPVVAGPHKRTIQVNVRLTPEEKSMLLSASSLLGFSGLSDFIRNAAIERVGSSAALLSKVMKSA